MKWEFYTLPTRAHRLSVYYNVTPSSVGNATELTYNITARNDVWIEHGPLGTLMFPQTLTSVDEGLSNSN